MVGRTASNVVAVALLATLSAWGPCGSPLVAPDAAGSTCGNGRLDCDGDPSNSCEVDPVRDPHSCGSCGLDCGGTTCVLGLCAAETIEPDGVRRRALRAVGDYLYWIDQGSFAIVRRKTSTGLDEVVVQDPMLSTTSYDVGFYVDGDELYYWGERLMHHDLAFGPITYGGPTRGAAIGNGELAWILNGPSTLESRAIDGGPEKSQPTAPYPFALVSDEAAFYWTTQGPVMDTPMGTVHVGGAVWRAPFGGAPVALAAVDSALELTEDETSLYFTSGSYAATRSVSSVPKAGGPIQTYGAGMLLASPVVDARFVYWLAYDSNYMPSSTVVWRADKVTGDAIEIAWDQRLSELAVDETDLYWIVAGTGEIRRMTKPTPAAMPATPPPPATCDDAACGAGQYCVLAGGCAPCGLADEDHCGTATSAPGGVRCPIGDYCNNGTCAACSLIDPQICGDRAAVRGCSTCAGATPTCAGGVCDDYSWTGNVVTDNQTGLKWERVPSTASFGFGSDTTCGFASADSRCSGLVLDGLSGWRVPTEAELLTLVRPASCVGCNTLDSTAFPTTSRYVWTSTLKPVCATCPQLGMFFVDFHGGYSSYAADSCAVSVPGPTLGVRCVHS